MKKPFVEHFALESSAKADGTRRVRLISPGQGSSGMYSREVLASYIAEALPKGTKVYLNHTDEEDEWKRGGTRKFQDVAGKIVTDPVYEADAPEGEGSYADVKFMREIEEKLEDIGDVVGVSVEIHAGRKDEYGNIIEMAAHPLNSLALVPEPGRDGRIFEDFRASALEKPNEEGEQDMAISKEDIAAIVAGVQEALKPEPKDEVEVDVAETIRKVMKAELPEPLEEAAIAEALESGDAEAAIAKQAKIVEAVKAVEKVEKTDDIDKGVRLSESAETKVEPQNDYERGQAYLERIKKAGK